MSEEPSADREPFDLSRLRELVEMMEKYDVTDLGLEAGGGEYPTQDGFGWTNGVAYGLIEWLRETGRWPANPPE